MPYYVKREAQSANADARARREIGSEIAEKIREEEESSQRRETGGSLSGRKARKLSARNSISEADARKARYTILTVLTDVSPLEVPVGPSRPRCDRSPDLGKLRAKETPGGGEEKIDRCTCASERTARNEVTWTRRAAIRWKVSECWETRETAEERERGERGTPPGIPGLRHERKKETGLKEFVLANSGRTRLGTREGETVKESGEREERRGRSRLPDSAESPFRVPFTPAIVIPRVRKASAPVCMRARSISDD